MGGNALKIKTRRYDKKEYYELVEIVSKKLYDNGYKFHVTTSFKDKDSFGDMDILINSKIDIDKLCGIFNPTDINLNDNCLSLDYKDFQLDFIHFDDEIYETAKVYYSYNDIHSYIGIIANSKFNLKWGFDGLKKKYKGENIYITRDYRIALDFLGFDVDRYDRGFETLEDTFDFICRSKYFSPDIFELQTLPSRYKNRSKKRKNYDLFLKYIDFNYDRILSEMFPMIKDEMVKVDNIEKEKNRRKELINGNIILSIDPQIDKLLMGSILYKMKGDEVTFTRTKEENIKVFFELYKEKKES